MTLRTWSKIHKWLWVFAGIFLLAWLGSGILMALPKRLMDTGPQVPRIAVDYEKAAISPARAIGIARRISGSHAPASRVIFRTLHDRSTYAVKLEGNPEILIDAVSGKPFEMSPELAKAIAMFNFPGVEPPLVVTKIDQHSLAYRHGGLPAFRVESQNDSSTRYFVSSVDGRVFRSTLFTRMRSALISLHDFSTLELITDSNRVRKLLLLAVSGIALVGTLIGYYMALPHGRRG
jgi:hypothetical protein